MKSLQPLVTITILAAAGLYLYFKIQEPATQPVAQSIADEAPGWKDYANDTLPPLAEKTIEAPTFPATVPETSSTMVPVVNVPIVEAPTATGNVPPLPDLPPLPSNIPTANYNDSPTTEVPTVSGRVPAMGTATPDLLNNQINPPSTLLPEQFANVKPAIQAALAQGDLPQAHLLLTPWRNDSSLTAEEQIEVSTLLSQLAGTVIFSNEHRLEPGYVVQPGETLQTIAAQHQVPWQLLAKINGIATADALQPGQTLKVLRGPFSAVVNSKKQELTLLLAGRYAGTFPVVAPIQASNQSEISWTVDQKQTSPTLPTNGSIASQGSRTINLRGEGLAQNSTTSIAPVGSAAPGAIQISVRDAEDLFDILSVGSRVIIRK